MEAGLHGSTVDTATQNGHEHAGEAPGRAAEDGPGAAGVGAGTTEVAAPGEMGTKDSKKALPTGKAFDRDAGNSD